MREPSRTELEPRAQVLSAGKWLELRLVDVLSDSGIHVLTCLPQMGPWCYRVETISNIIPFNYGTMPHLQRLETVRLAVAFR